MTSGRRAGTLILMRLSWLVRPVSISTDDLPTPNCFCQPADQVGIGLAVDRRGCDGYPQAVVLQLAKGIAARLGLQRASVSGQGRPSDTSRRRSQHLADQVFDRWDQQHFQYHQAEHDHHR